MIHILETNACNNRKNVKNSDLVADPKRAVKCFQRSAAGNNLCNPKNLRPPDVLFRTVNYLLTEYVFDLLGKTSFFAYSDGN